MGQTYLINKQPPPLPAEMWSPGTEVKTEGHFLRLYNWAYDLFEDLLIQICVEEQKRG